MKKTYTTMKSYGILLMYWLVLIFLLFMILGLPFFGPEEMKNHEQYLFYIVFVIIFLWFCWILYKIYNMKYDLDNGRLTIHGAFNKNTVHIHTIKSIEKSAIPIGIRLFGGSYIGGRYFLPGIGKAWVAMTNFKDGVLIKTQDEENYIITPNNPQDFINDINKLISK